MTVFASLFMEADEFVYICVYTCFGDGVCAYAYECRDEKGHCVCISSAPYPISLSKSRLNLELAILQIK